MWFKSIFYFCFIFSFFNAKKLKMIQWVNSKFSFVFVVLYHPLSALLYWHSLPQWSYSFIQLQALWHRCGSHLPIFGLELDLSPTLQAVWPTAYVIAPLGYGVGSLYLKSKISCTLNSWSSPHHLHCSYIPFWALLLSLGHSASPLTGLPVPTPTLFVSRSISKAVAPAILLDLLRANPVCSE